MSAHTFDTHFPICPICQRANAVKPHKLLTGLLTCHHCRERLVISWSGHYVRDPFTLKRLATGEMLRRESRPLARMGRDLKQTPYPLLLAVLGGAVVLGGILSIFYHSSSRQGFPAGESNPTMNIQLPNTSSYARPHFNWLRPT